LVEVVIYIRGINKYTFCDFLEAYMKRRRVEDIEEKIAYVELEILDIN